jgi:pimeloyl-ACP methyl ester carboxylesterase
MECPRRETNGITRREFAAASAGAIALASDLAAQTAPATSLDLAEWSYFWIGVERAELARGTVVNGRQMYVEYMRPAQPKHPYPIVMVHGGGGQGTDWMGTPDGRPGWAQYFLQEGYPVYVVDRPGHGRSPFNPDIDGPFPRGAQACEQVERQFTAPEKAEKPYAVCAKLHTQWPGTGMIGDPTVDQVVAGQGGSFLADLEATHNVWRHNMSLLLDKIGPAVIMSHSMGGPNGWIAGDARPNLVKGIIGVEPAGGPFGNLKWGLTANKVEYQPAVTESGQLKTKKITSANEGEEPCFMQEEPARQLVNLKGIPIAIVTSEASYHVAYDWGSVAFLRQAGCKVEHIRLAERGIHGNAHFMMMEKNSREVLQPILDWLPKAVEKKAVVRSARAGETALKLAGMGFFWVGTERRKMPYGTIQAGQMYVQYLTPAQVRHPYPVVLVHGGGGQMLHYMGLGDGRAGWAHYYLQAGYKVYLVDRPGHGRAPYHPDALGPIGPSVPYAAITVDTLRAATGPNHQWPGTGDVGDPLIDQLMAAANAAPQDNVMAHTLWASRGAELLDKIGPAIVQVHSAGGPFSWIVADARPKLVKAIVNVEGAGAPFTASTPWGLTDVPLAYDPPVSNPAQLAPRETGGYKLQAEPVRKLKNLAGIPIAYVTADKSGRTGAAVVAFLKQAGCDAEDFQLRDKGILGNGHFMMLENNRKQVFEAIRRWIESKAELAGD